MYTRIGNKRGVNPRDLARDRRKQAQRNPSGFTALNQSEPPAIDRADLIICALSYNPPYKPPYK
jgi:hypothetical protein